MHRSRRPQKLRTNKNPYVWYKGIPGGSLFFFSILAIDTIERISMAKPNRIDLVIPGLGLCKVTFNWTPADETHKQESVAIVDVVPKNPKVQAAKKHWAFAEWTVWELLDASEFWIVVDK